MNKLEINKDKVKEAILKHVKGAGESATFIDVIRIASEYIEVKGEYALSLPGNIILWADISETLVDIMHELLSDKKYRLASKITSIFTYLFDGAMLNLPIAKKIPRQGYKDEHWLPICFVIIDDDAKLNRTIDFIDYMNGCQQG